MRTSIRCLATLATLATLGACRHRDADTRFTDRDTTPAEKLGPNDMLMTTRDSAMQMGVIGDHITMRLAPKALDSVRVATDTSKVEGSGFAASLEKTIKRGVAAALQKQVDIPLSDVRDVRYENGRIVFDWNNKPAMAPDNTKSNGHDLLSSFSADDSQRFVAAVKAHKAGPAGR